MQRRVVGATGAQGGSLVRAILGDPAGGFVVRAVTRNVGSAKARELASLGAEVVTADVDDPASFKRAFAGACRPSNAGSPPTRNRFRAADRSSCGGAPGRLRRQSN